MELAGVMRKSGIFHEEIDKRLEQWLNRAHGNKDFDFREPVFTVPVAMGEPGAL
jgi:hypothetical protein